MTVTKNQAEQLLKTMLSDSSATFREGQWEAIDGVVNHNQRQLVIQKTGWGKSIVYFLASYFLRQAGKGPTLIVSPLLALMRNQVEMASRLGVRAKFINSSNTKDWEDIFEEIKANSVDTLLISPERLSIPSFKKKFLMPIASNIGLLVVDEAHCISDWGHDFRPDYRRLGQIIKHLPASMPIIATTATANDRVTKDIQRQLGEVSTLRGDLMRESLVLQNCVMNNQYDRLAWLSKIISKLDGSGIIYCLTTRDTRIVAKWLSQRGIDARAYYSGVKDPDRILNENEYRTSLENDLIQNKVKVLVATSALGMGFDMPDLHFVIHYQAPTSLISYYQQIGRAGRGLDTAHVILLSGGEEEDVARYFIEKAHPSKNEIEAVYEVLDRSEGLKKTAIEKHLNLSRGRICSVVKILGAMASAPIIEDDDRYFTTTAVSLDIDWDAVTQVRENKWSEYHRVQDYVSHSGCLMQRLAGELDNVESLPCGRCENCSSKESLDTSIDIIEQEAAFRFLHAPEISISPRLQVACELFSEYDFPYYLRHGGLELMQGMAFCYWGAPGWGKKVAKMKRRNHFSDELVEEMVELFKRTESKVAPEWITYVPCTKSKGLVSSLAERIAERLGLPLYAVVTKTRETETQKEQSNSVFQCKNIDGAFRIGSTPPSEPVLLIDDFFDSRWTLTVVGALLRQKGVAAVIPMTVGQVGNA